MYHDSGLCGFLKTTQRIINKKASLCEDLKFSSPVSHIRDELKFVSWQNSKQKIQLPKHKLIMAQLSKMSWFPDVSGYKGYRNS